MATSYEYSIGSVRAKEKELLTNADIEAMLACKTTNELIAFLRDKGYADGESIDELIKNSQRDTVEYLSKTVPDESVFDIFSYVNDAHNIKSVIKGLLADVDYEKLILSPYTVNPDDIVKAVTENKYELLPEEFSLSAKRSYETLAHTADARLSDAAIDTACMMAQLSAAEKSKIEFLIEYIKTDVFYRNVKTALRAALTDAPKSYYDKALIEGLDGFDKKDITKAALKGLDELCDYLALKDRYSCAKAIEEFKSSPAAFERYSENLLIKLAKEKCKIAGNGAEAALGFYIARLAEGKAVHIIAAGIETASESEITRERLRDMYG